MLPSREDDNWGIASRSFDVMPQAMKSRENVRGGALVPYRPLLKGR